MPSRWTFSIERIRRDLPIAAADGDDRQFAVERHELFEDERPAAELLPRGLAIVRVSQHGLPLAVVTEAPRLQHRGQADVADRGVELGARFDRGERRRRDAERREELLLDEPLLATLRALAAAGTPARARRATAPFRPARSRTRTSRRRTLWRVRRAPGSRRTRRECANRPARRTVPQPGRGRCSARRADSPPARASARVARRRECRHACSLAPLRARG